MILLHVSFVYRFKCPNGKHFSFVFIPLERLRNLSVRPWVSPSFLPSLYAYILKNCGTHLHQFRIREFRDKALKMYVGLINITLHNEVYAFMHTPSTCIGLLTIVLSQPAQRTVTYSVWRYQMLYNTILTSWWWAKQCSKQVEEYNKLIIKQEFVR